MFVSISIFLQKFTLCKIIFPWLGCVNIFILISLQSVEFQLSRKIKVDNSENHVYYRKKKKKKKKKNLNIQNEDFSSR